MERQIGHIANPINRVAIFAVGTEAMSKFQKTFCSQCGASFGPGDSGFSHCDQHTASRIKPNDTQLRIPSMDYPSHGKGHFAVVQKDRDNPSQSYWLTPWGTQEQADKDADRLQRENPKEEFAVIELVFRRYTGPQR